MIKRFLLDQGGIYQKKIKISEFSPVDRDINVLIYNLTSFKLLCPETVSGCKSKFYQ
jgi:hypothetical protein